MDAKEYRHKRGQILAKYRQQRFRVLRGSEDGLAFPIVDVKSILRWIEKEKIRELIRLEHKYKGLRFQGDSDVGWQEYEDYIAKHGVRAWARKHGYEPSSLKSEYVTFDDKGELKHDSDVCPRCGRMLKNCICKDNEKKSSLEWLKM